MNELNIIKLRFTQSTYNFKIKYIARHLTEENLRRKIMERKQLFANKK